jgi:hypothetical protein
MGEVGPAFIYESFRGVNASRPGSRQAHATLGSSWRLTHPRFCIRYDVGNEGRMELSDIKVLDFGLAKSSGSDPVRDDEQRGFGNLGQSG